MSKRFLDKSASKKKLSLKRLGIDRCGGQFRRRNKPTVRTVWGGAIDIEYFRVNLRD